ncbi:MAG: nucleotidyl transferase AbiEii/AbiGii toxin family protein [Elusimicrobia bacterium]|nr:nucleotidyl transferase AbiEii/AbiGii toxin family protein [Candidatus Liberimonas magnetica]
MRYEKDFKEFLMLLNKNRVRYCIVGAFAVGIHGRPRYTKDMDILVEPNRDNGKKVIKALIDFGFKELANQLNESDFEKKDNIVQIGQEPIRVDLIMSIKGVSFSKVWQNRKILDYYGQKVNYIGYNELVKSKEKTGRSIDLIDVENLRKIRKLNDKT